MKKIIYQGAPGSYSHSTGLGYFGNKNSFVGVRHFKDVFEAIKKGSADYGVIPIENTLAGSVYENYDYLFDYDVQIIAEHKLQIHHNLLGFNGGISEKLKKVYSHPKALEQCALFFENNPQIEEIVAYDTAGAAEMVSESEDKTLGAIASKEAAKLYNLKVLKTNIEDDTNNWTRFLIISKKLGKHDVKDANKASLIFSTSHRPGSLFNAIKSFADHRLNLTKLESRPMPNKPFEYFFYVDFEFDSMHLELVKDTLEELKANTHFLKILGHYEKY